MAGLEAGANLFDVAAGSNSALSLSDVPDGAAQPACLLCIDGAHRRDGIPDLQSSQQNPAANVHRRVPGVQYRLSVVQKRCAV